MPDIVLLQKVRNKRGLSDYPISGYVGYWTEEDLGMWSGVGTYIREGICFERIATPDLSLNGHFQLLRVGQILIGNAYTPFTNPKIADAKALRSRWDRILLELCRTVPPTRQILLCGDFNVVNDSLDACDSHIDKNSGCFLDWERANFRRILDAIPLFDTFRHLHPETRAYSYFSRPEYRTQDLGWRIDYALCSQTLMPLIKQSTIIKDFGSSKSLPMIVDIDTETTTGICV